MHFYHMPSAGVFITRGFEAAPALPTLVIPGPFPNAQCPGVHKAFREGWREVGWGAALFSFLFFK